MLGNKIKIFDKFINLPKFHKRGFSLQPLSINQNENIKRLNERIQNGNIIFETALCLCKSYNFDLVSSIDRHGILQSIVVCQECGLIQCNPRMNEISYRNFYESDLYRDIYHNENLESYAETKFEEKAVQAIFNNIVKHISLENITNVLEIGAGGGWNLLPFANEGIEVLGLDYGPRMVEIGRKHGINMSQGGLEKLDFLDKKFDVIILNHVLEHFLDPIKELKKIINHLMPDGIIYLGVPNIENFGISALQNAHVYYFNPTNFKYYVESSGLKIVDFGSADEIHMYGLFKISSTIISTKDLIRSKKENFKILKRAFYMEYLIYWGKRIGLHNLYNIFK
jgi:2-polyprenyl-3-methyl-5-hydroxy-6-metoxy-1,4-benzoquinol methylase